MSLAHLHYLQRDDAWLYRVHPLLSLTPAPGLPDTTNRLACRDWHAQVFNMPDVIVAMELTDEFNQFGFFASTEGAEFIQQARDARRPFPKPRLGRMWAF